MRTYIRKLSTGSGYEDSSRRVCGNATLDTVVCVCVCVHHVALVMRASRSNPTPILSPGSKSTKFRTPGRCGAKCSNVRSRFIFHLVKAWYHILDEESGRRYPLAFVFLLDGISTFFEGILANPIFAQPIHPVYDSTQNTICGIDRWTRPIHPSAVLMGDLSIVS